MLQQRKTKKQTLAVLPKKLVCACFFSVNIATKLSYTMFYSCKLRVNDNDLARFTGSV